MRRFTNTDRSKLAMAGLVLGVVLFFAVNIFSNAAFQAARLDLTEDKLFTLSKGTRNVLGNIEEPITLKLFYSKPLGERSPQHATYFERIRELLARYQDISGGKVRLDIINPEPFSNTEDDAVAAGMQGIPLNNAGDLGYFGLAGSNSTDDVAAIPFFTPERETFLEYDLTKVVYTLADPDRKIVGVISSLPITGGAMRPPFNNAPRWAILDQISEFFDLRPLPKQLRQIPKDIDILLLVHPKGFDDFTMYAIDQFALAGGRVLAFVDANAEVDVPPDGRMVSMPRSDFNTVLGGWGLKLADGKVAGDLGAARRVNVRAGGKLSVVDYVVWLGLDKKNFDAADAVTGDLSAINMAGAGILEKTGTEGVTIQPLISTGEKSMAIDADKVIRQPDAVGLFRDFKPTGKPLMLAARVQGTIKTAFPGGAPKEPSGPDKGAKAKGVPESHLAQSAKPANLIVVADVDMLHERFWADVRQLLGQRLFVPHANNADFVVNALDNLGGSDALIGLRGRAPSARPFTMVQDIRQTAERKFRTKERALQEKLEDARNQLSKLQRRGGAEGAVVISTDDKAAIDKIKGQMIAIRGELRDVQRALRKDLDRLETFLKFINIGLIPLLLAAGAIFATLIGRFRRTAVIQTD
ncbi:MAG: Gldg family protein [Rhodospirillales bacterium]|nr:Gldg family protein [Alphaproteobacteria bacterium]MBL6948124.1 Gldg family protein [Rhodospirillales bacterium]